MTQQGIIQRSIEPAPNRDGEARARPCHAMPDRVLTGPLQIDGDLTGVGSARQVGLGDGVQGRTRAALIPALSQEWERGRTAVVAMAWSDRLRVRRDHLRPSTPARSEERRVGKECRSRWS